MIFDGKTVLITGGTGTIGTALVKRIFSEHKNVKKVIVFSRDETKQNILRQYFLDARYSTDEIVYKDSLSKLEFIIGDIRDRHDVLRACKGADIVINAAALKQVPSCEYFPEQAIATNCTGAANIVRVIEENNLSVETVIGISTDKACKPTTVMGETKALQERIFTKANINSSTRYVCVRYGNVISSRESVIPLFKEQIGRGAPVTLTDENMTRFLISIEDAVEIILYAIEEGRGGEIFIPIIPSFKIENIAKALIGDKDVEIVKTGIRPNEKLHELLVSEEESPNTSLCGNYYVIHSMLPELFKEYNQIITDEYSSKSFVHNLEETVLFLKEKGVIE